MTRIKRALGASDAARGLYDLNVRLGLPTGLKDLGMQEKDIGKAVEVVMAAKIKHPRAVPKDEMTDIITQAYAGRSRRNFRSEPFDHAGRSRADMMAR